MLLVHQRMAELSRLQRRRPLTVDEEVEMEQCLHINEDYAYKLSSLENLSLIAYEVNDVAWQHEICANIEKLEGQYNIKRSAPFTKRTDEG